MFEPFWFPWKHTRMLSKVGTEQNRTEWKKRHCFMDVLFHFFSCLFVISLWCCQIREGGKAAERLSELSSSQTFLVHVFLPIESKIWWTPHHDTWYLNSVNVLNCFRSVDLSVNSYMQSLCYYLCTLWWWTNVVYNASLHSALSPRRTDFRTPPSTVKGLGTVLDFTLQVVFVPFVSVFFICVRMNLFMSWTPSVFLWVCVFFMCL